MKNSILGVTVLCFVVCLTLVPRAEARAIRSDVTDPDGCPNLANWTTATPGPSPFSPGSITVGSSSGSDSVVICQSTNSTNTAADGMFATNADPEVNAAYMGNNQSGAFLASSGLAYQFVNNPNGFTESQVMVWTLANGDTELELNGWCQGTATGTFTWGNDKFTGGCGASTNDFVFTKAGTLAGYVNDEDGANGLFVSAKEGAAIQGWSETTSTTVSAPELDPASAFGTLTLLAGCLAVLHGNRRKVYISATV
jgi:hypothetical protein